jgi:hypothetical protein
MCYALSVVRRERDRMRESTDEQYGRVHRLTEKKDQEANLDAREVVKL